MQFYSAIIITSINTITTHHHQSNATENKNQTCSTQNMATLLDFATHLFMGMPPCAHPFISADWYMGPLGGCCCIMGFCGPPIRPAIILGGLLPVPMNEGSPCWPIAVIAPQKS